MTKKTVCLLFTLLLNVAAHAESSERILWDQKPIPVSLPVGQERIIHFPADVRYWMPDAVKSALSIMAANGVLYVKGTRTFEKTRIRIQEIASTQVYLLDMQGVDGGTYPQEIIIQRREDVANKAKPEPAQPVEQDWYARLTRVAVQNLYAPERLIERDPDIWRVKLKSREPVDLIRGGEIEAIPYAAWQGGGYYVTAVRLRNTGQHERVIDPRTDIRSKWLVATLQHPSMTAAGTDDDRTCIYLISEQRFEDALP